MTTRKYQVCAPEYGVCVVCWYGPECGPVYGIERLSMDEERRCPCGCHIPPAAICPDCRVERTDYEGPDAYLEYCPNCGSMRSPRVVQG